LDFVNQGASVGVAVELATDFLGDIEVRYDNEFGIEQVFPYERIPLYWRGDESQYLNMPS
jgi:hypothetical protein